MNFLIQLKRNSAIAERYFGTKLKHNPTSAIEISHHNANTTFFLRFETKKELINAKEGRNLFTLQSKGNKIKFNV